MRWRYLIVVGALASHSFTQESGIDSLALASYQLGLVHWMTGNPDSALFAFERAVTLSPDYLEGCLAIGDMHVQMAQFGKARAAYERALKIQPQSAEAYLGLGHVCWNTEGEAGRALEFYQQALALAPENARAHAEIGKALTSFQRYDEAITHLEAAIRRDPNLPEPHASLGLCYLAQGKIEPAARQWQELKRKGGLSHALIELARNLLATVPENGILFTNGEHDTLPVWYLQMSTGERRDLSVVNVSLLSQRWYLKFLRDHEPGVAVQYDDEFLENKLKERYWPRPGPMEIAGLRWLLPPPPGLSNLRVQDLMMLKIIEWNDWQRPIYFAVTLDPANKLSLDEFLTLEGLAWHLQKEKAGPVHIENTWQNLREQYRLIHAGERSASGAAQRLNANYAVITCLLAEALLKKRDFERGGETLAWADSVGILNYDFAYHWAATLAGGMGQDRMAEIFSAKAAALRKRHAR